jgi:hypothetical protein
MGSRIAAEISIEVIAGSVSAVWIDESYSVIEGTERYASAMLGLHRLVVPVFARPMCRLVLRNWGPNSIPATFRIVNVNARIHRPADSRYGATSGAGV